MEAVDVGHTHIEKEAARLHFSEAIQKPVARLVERDAMVGRPQQATDGVAKQLVVVDDMYSELGRVHVSVANGSVK